MNSSTGEARAVAAVSQLTGEGLAELLSVISEAPDFGTAATLLVAQLADVAGSRRACLLTLDRSNQLVQISSNMAIRGRVMSLYIMVLIGGQAIGGPMIGSIAEHLDPQTALLVAGGVPALAAATVAVVLARKGELQLKVDFRDRRRLLRVVQRAA